MAISFANSVGNLYNRLGKLGALIANVRTHQAAQLQSMTNTTTGVTAQFASESDIQALMGNTYIGILSGVEGACQTAVQIAQATISRVVYRDRQLNNQTLQGINLIGSINEVIRQMKLAGATILAQTITATPGTFTGVGNGIINLSTKRPSDGLVCENSFAETLTFTVTSDSYSGSATAGNEGILVTGQGNQSDVFAFNWPLGSNCSQSINAIDGNTDNGDGNILTNSGFENWTGGLPNNYVINVNNSTIFQESTLIYDGLSALRILGDGTTLTSFQQTFNSSTGTLGTLSPQSQYSFNIFMRRDGVVPGAGVLTIDFVDQNGNVIVDPQGVANTFTISLPSLTTVYQSFTGIFRTPEIMPTSISIRYHLTTALTTARSVYLDKSSLGNFTQLYTSGPSAASHSGSVPFQIGDYAFSTIGNSRGAAGTLSTFQTLLNVLLNTQANDILFPSSSLPSIADALIA